MIYVQHDEPTDPKQRQNWLPAPKEGFQFTARFYGPPPTPLIDSSYDIPGVVRVDRDGEDVAWTRPETAAGYAAGTCLHLADR